MTFLGISQALGWTLVGATALTIVVIFFLRIQHRQIVVSSSILWNRVLEKRKRRSWLEILRRLLSLLIALMIGLSLMMAFGEVELGSGGRDPRRVRLVVDTRVSMAATNAAGTARLESARDGARRLLSGGSAADTFAVYDATGRVVAPASRDRERAREALDALRPIHRRLRLPDPEPGTETWVLTDGVAISGVPDDYKVVPVFEEADNVGVAAFEVRPWPTDAFRHEAFLEVGNFSASAHDVTIVLRDSAGVQFRRTVTLGAREVYRNTFDLSPLAGGVLRAEVSADGDRFAMDDAAYAYLPRQRPTRLVYVGDPGSLLHELLAADPHVEPTLLDPSQYESWALANAADAETSEAYDAGIFEDYVPSQPPPFAALFFGPPAVDWLPRGSEVVVEPVARDLRVGVRLLDDVDLHDVRIDEARRIDAAGNRVLVADGDLALVVEGQSRAPWILTTFRLRASDFQHTAAFPIFVSNAIEWLRAELPTVHAELGPVYVDMPAARVVDTATGDDMAVRTVDGRTLFDTTTPGLFLATDGRQRMPVVVGGPSLARSAINETRLDDLAEAIESPPAARRLWPTLLAIAAALLILEGLTYHRRITV